MNAKNIDPPPDFDEDEADPATEFAPEPVTDDQDGYDEGVPDFGDDPNYTEEVEL